MKSLKEKILKYANWLCLGSRTKDDKGKNREEDGELPNNQTINPSIPPQENDRKTGKKTINYCANDPNFNMDLCPCCQMNPKNDTNNDDLTLPLRLYCAYSNTICEISQLCEVCKESVNELGYTTVSHVWGEYDLSNPDSEQQVIELKNCKIIVASERIRKNAQRATDAGLNHSALFIWMDVLCIDQNSVKEMHREVPMMATYYKNAKDCLVMLEEDTDVTSIIEKIDLICDDINKDKKPAREKVEELSLNTAELLNNSKFAWDPWFERIWTYQEAIFSKKLMYYDGEKNHNLNSVFNLLQVMSTGDKSAGSFFFMLEKFLEKFKNRLFIDIVLKDHDNSLEENITLKQAYSIAQIRKTYDKRDIIFGTLSMTKLSVPVECFSMEYPNLIRTACKLSLGRGDVSWLPLYGGPVANAANYCCIVDPLNARSCLADIKLDLNYTKVVEVRESGVKLVVKKYAPVAASPWMKIDKKGELKEKDNVNLLRSVYKTFEESGSKNPGLMTARTLLAMHNNVPESVVEVIDEMVKPNDKRKTLINTNAKNYHEAYGLLSFSVNVICGFNNLPGETKYIILISVPIGEEIHTLLFISDTDALVSDNIIVLESLIVDTYGRRMWMLCTSDDSSTRKVAVGRWEPSEWHWSGNNVGWVLIGNRELEVSSDNSDNREVRENSEEMQINQQAQIQIPPQK